MKCKYIKGSCVTTCLSPEIWSVLRKSNFAMEASHRWRHVPFLPSYCHYSSLTKLPSVRLSHVPLGNRDPYYLTLNYSGISIPTSSGLRYQIIFDIRAFLRQRVDTAYTWTQDDRPDYFERALQFSPPLEADILHLGTEEAVLVSTR